MFRVGSLMMSLLLSSTVAHAADLKICVVDAEYAINETNEGKEAQRKLEGMYSAKQAELEKIQKDFEREIQDYESRKPILSEAARQEQEQGLLEKRQQLQMMVVQAEQDMQETYMQMLGGMEEKLIAAAEKLGATKGCTVLLQKAAVIFAGNDVVDLTSDLVTTYDAK